MGLFPPYARLETWIACLKAAGNGPADRGATDHDLCNQPHSNHVAVSIPWGPTWSPYLYSFAFSPVLPTAVRLPFLEPGSDYVHVLFCSEVIGGPTSNEIMSSCLGQHSWCYPLQSQMIFPRNGAALVKVPQVVSVHVSKPVFSSTNLCPLPEVPITLSLFQSQEALGTCPPWS